MNCFPQSYIDSTNVFDFTCMDFIVLSVLTIVIL